MASNISLDDYEVLCVLAREFNEWVPPERVMCGAASAPSDVKGERPGDVFNAGAAWPDILQPHGWTVDHTAGDVTYWTRPGKKRFTSATTGKCKTEGSGDLLYVFSSNAHPFDAEAAYSKFAAHAFLNHGGDFGAAASDLAGKGYVKPRAGDPSAHFPSVLSVPAKADDGRRFKWSSELTAPEKADDWIWHGYLPKAGIALLSALWKVGKTTLLSHLLKACGTGGDFLGRPIKACKVLYVSEEGERHWVRRRDALGFHDNVGFYLQPFPTRPAQSGWASFVALLKGDIEAHGFDLVVFDTLAKLWPVTEENDAGAVDGALMPLWELTKAGAGVLLIHHLRKSGGQEYTGSRGSGALSAFPDILIELTRADAADDGSKKRTLRAKGRYEETPDELTIELIKGEYVAVKKTTDEPTVVFTSGGVELDDKDGRVVKVLNASCDPWMTSDQIRAALAAAKMGMRDESVSVALDSLYQKKQLLFAGKLRSKTDPRRYALASRSDAIPPLGVGGNETLGMRSGGPEASHSEISFPPDTQGRSETAGDEAAVPMWWALFTSMLHTNGPMTVGELQKLSGYGEGEIQEALSHWMSQGLVTCDQGVYRVVITEVKNAG